MKKKKRKRNLIRRMITALKNGLKKNLFAGLLFLMPLVGTYYFIHFCITQVDKILLLLPQKFQPQNFLPFKVPGLGLILVVVILFLTGIFVRNLLGRTIVNLGERIFSYIPFVSKFYSALKQLIETIFNTSTKDFKRVVLIQYPRQGLYTMAFVTGVSVGEIQRKTPKRVINVFVPTTPNPTSGFYLMVPEDDVIPLEMSVEDSFKLLISGGILNPDEIRKKKESAVKRKGKAESVETTAEAMEDNEKAIPQGGTNDTQ